MGQLMPGTCPPSCLCLACPSDSGTGCPVSVHHGGVPALEVTPSPQMGLPRGWADDHKRYDDPLGVASVVLGWGSLCSSAHIIVGPGTVL